MANEDHLARLKQGVDVWNQWRSESFFTAPQRADLQEANLAGEDLPEANLDGANLQMVVLIRANLIRANLYQADLSGAKLQGADLRMADLTKANLKGVDFTDAILSRVRLNAACLIGADFTTANLDEANLYGANLDGANLHWVSIGETVFGDVDLSTVRGLDTVRHHGPSSIGIDTLYRSKGNIPEVFLRGAGVPDEVITYAKSLVGRPFEFYSCFISYSSRDQAFAERLHADLQNQGVRCWFAPRRHSRRSKAPRAD
jgi:uncharacterized protein YjbI with pentapeptide repeats